MTFLLVLILNLWLISLLAINSSALAQSGNRLVVHYVEGSTLEGKIGYKVNIYLSALDADGNAISGLTKDDFRVSEDARQVELDGVSRSSNLPIGILILIDTSGSMQGKPIQEARSSAAAFISSLGENDQIAVASFNENLNVHSEFEKDRTRAVNLINQIDAVNLASTCLYDALYSTVQKTATLESGRRALILLTDGQDYKADNTCSVHTLDDVINLASQGSTRVPIHTIGLGTDVDQNSLQRLSSMSGGLYHFAPDANQLKGIFETLTNQLRSEYVLTYESSSTPGAHGVLVEMKYNNEVTQDSRNFSLPSLPTTLTIISPVDGQEISGKTKLAVSLGGSGEVVEKIAFYLGDKLIATDTTLPYEQDYEFSPDQAGSQVLSVKALGANDEELAAASIGIAILEAPPPSLTPDLSINDLSGLRPFTLGAGGLAAAVLISFLVIRARKKSSLASEEGKASEVLQSEEDRTIDNLEMNPDASGLKYGQTLASLTILNSDDLSMIGQELSITKLPTTIGRSASNDIVISKKDQPVSRNHAILEQQGGNFILKEATVTDEYGNFKQPTYGTFVNDIRVLDENITLQDGDEIRLGSRFRMRFNQSKLSIGSEEKTMDGFELIDEAEKTREADHGLDSTLDY